LLANLLATSTALDLPAEVVCGFVDAEINRLLDLNTEREVAFSVVSIGHVAQPPPLPPKEILSLELETVPLSRQEVDYPAMREMHAASSLLSPEEVAAWRGDLPLSKPTAPLGGFVPLQPLGDADIPRDAVERVILRRGSTRQFARESITFVQLSTMLERATSGVPADFLDLTNVLIRPSDQVLSPPAALVPAG